MNKLFMGIDCGSQSTKVGIFDQNGNEICYGNDLLRPTETPKPGVVYHPDEDLWDSLVRAIENCLSKFEGNRTAILGIGLCTIRCCRVLLDKEGKLVEPVISWMDMRMAKPYVHENDDVAYVTTTSGYLSYRLTGARKDSCSNHEVYWPMDFHTLQWQDENKISECGLRRDQLFDLVKSGEVFGKLKPELAKQFGLRDGIEIFATGNDKAVEVLGSGLNDEGQIMISLGTFISAMVYRENYFDNAQTFFPTLACEPFKFVYECTGIRRGMWTISWFKNLAGSEITHLAEVEKISEENVLNRIAEQIPPGSEGLITVLDWLSPPDKPYRKGMMIGLDQRHTKFHMYRSILEAIAYTIKNNIDLMTNETKMDINQVTIIGGGSKSNILVQIICDLFGLKTMTMKSSSSACLGAAMCVAVGLGIFKDFKEAKNQMVQVKKVYQPNLKNNRYYHSVNENVFSKVRSYTDPLLQMAYPYLNNPMHHS